MKSSFKCDIKQHAEPFLNSGMSKKGLNYRQTILPIPPAIRGVVDSNKYFFTPQFLIRK
jgi:hypothetical protein